MGTDEKLTKLVPVASPELPEQLESASPAIRLAAWRALATANGVQPLPVVHAVNQEENLAVLEVATAALGAALCRALDSDLSTLELPFDMQSLAELTRALFAIGANTEPRTASEALNEWDRLLATHQLTAPRSLQSLALVTVTIVESSWPDSRQGKRHYAACGLFLPTLVTHCHCRQVPTEKLQRLFENFLDESSPQLYVPALRVFGKLLEGMELSSAAGPWRAKAVALFESPVVQKRLAGLEALGVSGGPQVVPLVLRAAQDADAKVRLGALGLVNDATVVLDVETIRSLAEQFMSDGNILVRHKFVEVLDGLCKRFPELVENSKLWEFLETISSTNLGAKRFGDFIAAAIPLWSAATVAAKVVPPALALLQSECPVVLVIGLGVLRSAAVKLEPENSLALLRHAERAKTHHEWRVRLAYFQTLEGLLDSTVGTAALVESLDFLSDPAAFVRWTAAQCLPRIAKTPANATIFLNGLTGIAKHHSHSVRLSAAHLIRELAEKGTAQEKCNDLLGALRRDPVDSVRRAADGYKDADHLTHRLFASLALNEGPMV